MIDPISYFESRRIDYHLAGEKNVSRGWVNIQCPFPYCGDPSWHCGINLESEMYNCFHCRKKGHISELIAHLENCSISQARSLLNSLFYPSNPNQARLSTPTLYPCINKLKIPLNLSNSFPNSYLDSLIDKGFDPDFLIQKYQLKALPNFGQYKFGIFIPYFFKQQMVTFMARNITGQYKKCRNEDSIIPVNQTMYNIDSVKDRILIVEGPTDVWNIGDGAVATSTINYTMEQVILLNKKVYEGVKAIFIMYDAEEFAIAKAKELASRLSCEHVEVLELSSPSDPGNMTQGEVRHLRKQLGL